MAWLNNGSARTIIRLFVILIIPLAVMIALADGILIPKIKQGYIKGTASAAVPVKLFLVKENPYSLPVTYTGSVSPSQLAHLSAKVTAQVTEVNFQEGGMVQKGDLLIRLDASDLEAQASEADAEVSSAKAVLEQDEIAYQQAETDFARDQSLYADGAITQYDYQHAKDLVAQRNLAVSQARAELSSDEANAAYAKAMVGYTSIYAPFSGVITKKEVNVGDMATPGTELCVEESGPYRLDVPIPESYQEHIGIGSTATVDIPAIGAHFEGTVGELVPAVNPNSMTYMVKILLPGNVHVTSGMYGNATFTVGEAKDIFVPQSAVIRWGDFNGVMVDNNGVATLNYVTLGKTIGDKVQILSGISANEKIVVDPVNIDDGQKIEGELISE